MIDRARALERFFEIVLLKSAITRSRTGWLFDRVFHPPRVKAASSVVRSLAH